jgi:3-hydroxyacyl-CoA dehydrogenase
MAGIDILVHTDRVMSRAFPRHGPLSQVAVRLVEQGHLGQKAGLGVYKYSKGDYTPYGNSAADQIIAEVQQEKGRAPREVGMDEITRRLVLRMVGEAFYVMEEGIAQRASDVDAAMVLGAGFPDFRGGVFKYAQDIEFDNLVMQLEELAETFGQRFSPCQLLREMARTREGTER